MRIPTTCFQCTRELLARDGTTDEELQRQPRYLAELTDDNAYVGHCDKEHEIRFTLQNLRYEILFEAAAVAFHCGFYREALASAATALERFWEFAYYMFTEVAGVAFDEVEKAWEEMGKQSERQLGAFLSLYVTTFKRRFTPPTGTPKLNKLSELRNEVVHSGKIPTRTETETYLRHVYNIVRTVDGELRAHAPEPYRIARHRLGSLRGHVAIEKKAGQVERAADGMFYGAATQGFNLMLSDIVTGQDNDFASRLAFARSNLRFWGLALPDS